MAVALMTHREDTSKIVRRISRTFAAALAKQPGAAERTNILSKMQELFPIVLRFVCEIVYQDRSGRYKFFVPLLAACGESGEDISMLENPERALER